MNISGHNILIVDDDNHNAELMSEILVNAGFNILKTESGSSALEILKKNEVNIAIIDIRLPDMNGLDLMRHIKKHSQLIDVVIATGNASVYSAIAALNEGARRYLLKPCAPEELLSIINDIVERQTLYYNNQTYLRRLEVLNSLTTELSTAISPEEVLKNSLQVFSKIAEVSACAAFLIKYGRTMRKNIRSRATGKVHFAGHLGSESEMFSALLKSGAIERFLSNRKRDSICIWRDKPTAEIEPLFKKTKLERIILHKIYGKENILGVFVLGSRVNTSLDDSEMELLKAMSLQVGVSLERANLFKNIEEALDNLRNTQKGLLLAEKQSAVGRLAAGLAHEIGNPLNIISGRAEFLLSQTDDDNMKSGLKIIVQQIERISRLIRQLMDFAREYNPEKESVMLEEIIKSVISLLEVTLKTKQIDLSLNIPKHLPRSKANFNQMQQVFINLIMNSIDAIDAKKEKIGKNYNGRIDIFAEPNNRTKKIKVDVRDNGIGIPEEHLNKIFDPFFSTKKGGMGTGLGLAVVYGIITEHGGNIEPHSVYGEGTVISFTIPFD